MRVFFDNIDVLVQNSGILATNASVSQSNSIAPAYVLGKYWATNQVPAGPIKSTFAFSYYPTTTGDPSYDILNTIKGLADDVLYSGATVEIAGVTGYNCYLQNYELQSSPNSIIKSNTTYVTYTPLSGQITSKTGTTDFYRFNDRLAHGWTTYVSSSGNQLVAPTYDFTYKFTAGWEPIYLIGQKFPSQVNFMNGVEEMSFVRDSFTHIQFSGEGITGTLVPSDRKLELFNYKLIATRNFSGALVFDVSGAKITDTKLVADLDNFVRSQTSIRRFY